MGKGKILNACGEMQNQCIQKHKACIFITIINIVTALSIFRKWDIEPNTKAEITKTL